MGVGETRKGALDRSGNDERRTAGRDGIRTGRRVLRIGRGRDGDPSGDGGKESRALVVGVVGRQSKRGTVERYAEPRKCGIEGVGERHVVFRRGGGLSVVQKGKGVGQRSVFIDGHRRDVFADREIRRGVRRYGRGGGNGGRDSRAGHGRRIDGRSRRAERCELVGDRLVDEQKIPAGGDGQPVENEGRSCIHDRVGGGDAVQKSARRADHVRERHDRAGTDGVCAEIVAHRNAGSGGVAAVRERDHIGDPIALTVSACERGLCHGKRADDFSRRNVGVDGIAAVGELRLVGESCHKILLVFHFL